MESLSAIANAAIGREKHGGQSSGLMTFLYSKPMATIAASLMQVPPAGPGNSWEPSSSFQLRMWFRSMFAPPKAELRLEK